MRKQSQQLGDLLINWPMMKLAQKSTFVAGAVTKSSLPKGNLELKSEGNASHHHKPSLALADSVSGGFLFLSPTLP
jgi:hypothetical protein